MPEHKNAVIRRKLVAVAKIQVAIEDKRKQIKILENRAKTHLPTYPYSDARYDKSTDYWVSLSLAVEHLKDAETRANVYRIQLLEKLARLKVEKRGA